MIVRLRPLHESHFTFMRRLPLKGVPRKNVLNRSFTSVPLDGITHKLPLWASAFRGARSMISRAAQICSYRFIVRFALPSMEGGYIQSAGATLERLKAKSSSVQRSQAIYFICVISLSVNCSTAPSVAFIYAAKCAAFI